jgi:hypothetical protein
VSPKTRIKLSEDRVDGLFERIRGMKEAEERTGALRG